MLVTFSAFAQKRNVSGVVMGSEGEVLVGAGVIVQGTKIGTITDIDGKFVINVDPSESVVFSYVGYENKVVQIGNQSNLKVVLQPIANNLNETVVVGYATQKKINLTGSVSTLSSKEIQDIPVANTASLLQGRLPGLVITQNGAQAGNDNPEIRIRGIGTFGNNNPMVLIDGIEGTIAQISEIPAADIENISVLKDAASAAIYGVRAANGVILITTKKGTHAEGIKLAYQGSYTFQTPGIIPNYVDGYNWALMRNENDVASGNAPTYSNEALSKLQDGSDPDHYANTDWLREVLRNAGMQKHHFSVTGGRENTHFMTSISYSDQEGIMKETGVQRISFRSNLDTKYKKFRFGLNISGNKNDIKAPAVAPSGGSSIMRFISWFTHPTVPVKYSNGKYGYIDGSLTNPEMLKNPLELMSLGHRTNERWRFNGKTFASIDIYKGLQFKTNLSYALEHNATKSYSPKSPSRYNAEGNVIKEGGKTNQQVDYWYSNATCTNENLLTYNQKLNKHSLNVLLGHSIISSKWRNTTASIQGFPTENIYELDGGTINPNAKGKAEEYRLQSFFGRINYSYDDKYLIEANVRHDGSSRMPKVHRYATFPSLSAGWVFSKENFMKELVPLTLGKLRFSWGKLGNQEIGNYAYSATLAASGNYFFDQLKDKQAGMVQTSIPNENIKWETTRSINVALDLGFYDNKLTTTFEWFDKKTDDILMQLAMPGIFLGSLKAPYQNVGAVRNRGWEWIVNYVDGYGDWSWNIGFNLAHVKNEILEMGDLTETIGNNIINRVGQPINAYFGYKSLGLYRTEADLQRKNDNGDIIMQNGVAPKLGDIMYDDVNNDGNITPEDRVIIGNPFPKYSYSFNLGVSWKGFDFSTFWQGVQGIYRYSWETTSEIRGNFTDRWLDRWNTDNVNASMPALGNTINNSYSSFWLEKADYLRLKNLELGYTLRQSRLEKVGISSVRFFFAGSNLMTFTPLKNWDPEKTSGDSRNDVHPNMRTYSFGINVQFK